METRLKRRSTPRRFERRTRREWQFGHFTDGTETVEGLTPPHGTTRRGLAHHTEPVKERT
jgi:hypothetical protein